MPSHCSRTFESGISLRSHAFTRIPKLPGAFFIGLPRYFPRFFAEAMPSACRCKRYPRSNSATAPNTVNMNFPVGVVVSMFSFWLTNSTPFAASFSTNSSRSRVFLAKRLMLSTITLSPCL